MEKETEFQEIGLEKSDTETSDSEDEIGDEEMFQQIASGQLPQSEETLVALNLCYQETLEELVEMVDKKIKANEKKQISLLGEKEKSCYDGGCPDWIRVPVLQYIPPYFRDSAGMAPKSNADTLQKNKRKELDPLVEPPKKWSTKEKNNLLQAVNTSLVEKQAAPLTSKRVALANEWKTAGEGKHKSLNKQISELDKQIDKLRNKKFELSQLSEDEFKTIDWNKVSAADMKGTRSALECRLAFFNQFHPKLNQDERWSEIELNDLREIAGKNGRRDWKAIAAELGTNRTAFQCFEKFHTELNTDILKREWTDVEDQKLREAVEGCRMGDYIPWELVTGQLEGRTRAQCQSRWSRKLDPSLKTGRWNKVEDEALLEAVRKHGVTGWKKISSEVPGRTEAQCRERWSSALRGDIRTGPWTTEEDETLLDGLKLFGAGKWSKVCTLLSGRTPSACKIRFRTLSKKKKRESQKMEKLESHKMKKLEIKKMEKKKKENQKVETKESQKVEKKKTEKVQKENKKVEKKENQKAEKMELRKTEKPENPKPKKKMEFPKMKKRGYRELRLTRAKMAGKEDAV